MAPQKPQHVHSKSSAALSTNLQRQIVDWIPGDLHAENVPQLAENSTPQLCRDGPLKPAASIPQNYKMHLGSALQRLLRGPDAQTEFLKGSIRAP